MLIKGSSEAFHASPVSKAPILWVRDLRLPCSVFLQGGPRGFFEVEPRTVAGLLQLNSSDYPRLLL